MLEASQLLCAYPLRVKDVTELFGILTCVTYTEEWLAVGTFLGFILVFDASHNLIFKLKVALDEASSLRLGKVTCLCIEMLDKVRKTACIVGGFESGLVCRWAIAAQSKTPQLSLKLLPTEEGGGHPSQPSHRLRAHEFNRAISSVKIFPDSGGQAWISADASGKILIYQIPNSLFTWTKHLMTSINVFDYIAIPDSEQNVLSVQVHKSATTNRHLSNSYYMAATTPLGLYMFSIFLESNTTPKVYFLDYFDWSYFSTQKPLVPCYSKDFNGLETISGNSTFKPCLRATMALCAFATVRHKVHAVVSVDKSLYAMQLLLKSKSAFEWRVTGCLSLEKHITALRHWQNNQYLCVHLDSSASIVQLHQKSIDFAIWPFEQQDLQGISLLDRLSFLGRGSIVTQQLCQPQPPNYLLPSMNESVWIDAKCHNLMVLFSGNNLICSFQGISLQQRLSKLDKVRALKLGRAIALQPDTSCFLAHDKSLSVNKDWLTDWLLNLMVDLLAEDLFLDDEAHVYLLLALLFETASAIDALDFIFETICETCYDLNVQNIYWELLESLIIAPEPQNALENALAVPIAASMPGAALNLMLRHYSQLPNKWLALDRMLPLLPLDKCDRVTLFGVTLHARLWLSYASACCAFQCQLEGVVVLLKNALQSIGLARKAEAIAAFCLESEIVQTDAELDLLVPILFELLEKSLCGEAFSSKWTPSNKEHLEGESWRFLLGSNQESNWDEGWSQVLNHACLAELSELANADGRDFPYAKCLIERFPLHFYQMLIRIFDGNVLDGWLIILYSGEIGRDSDRLILGLETRPKGKVEEEYRRRVMKIDGATELDRQFVLDRLYNIVLLEKVNGRDAVTRWEVPEITLSLSCDDVATMRFYCFVILGYARHKGSISLPDLFLRHAVLYICHYTIKETKRLDDGASVTSCVAGYENQHRANELVVELKLREQAIRELLLVFDPIFSQDDVNEFPLLFQEAKFFELCQEWYRAHGNYDKLLPCMLSDEEHRKYALSRLEQWHSNDLVRKAIPWNVVWQQLIDQYVELFVEQNCTQLALFVNRIYGASAHERLSDKLKGMFRFKYLRTLYELDFLSKQLKFVLELVDACCSYDRDLAPKLFRSLLIPRADEMTGADWHKLSDTMGANGLLLEQCECLLFLGDFKKVYDLLAERLKGDFKEISDATVGRMKDYTLLIYRALAHMDSASLSEWTVPLKCLYKLLRMLRLQGISLSLQNAVKRLMADATVSICRKFSVLQVFDALPSFEGEDSIIETTCILPVLYTLLQEQKDQACLSQVELEYLQANCQLECNHTAETAMKGHRVVNHRCCLSKTEFSTLTDRTELLAHLACGHVSIKSIYTKVFNFIKTNFNHPIFSGEGSLIKSSPCILCNSDGFTNLEMAKISDFIGSL